MALREFRDTHGIEWRVWATLPEETALVRVDLRTLGDLEKGWLTFECADGRRRLAPFPADWASLSDAELERWCSEAKAPPPRRSGVASASAAAPPSTRGSANSAALDPSGPTRTFTGASGRLWRVAEQERTALVSSPGVGEQRVITHFVLRFTSENEVLELGTYPMAWARLSDAQLLKLARQAALVRTESPSAHAR